MTVKQWKLIGGEIITPKTAQATDLIIQDNQVFWPNEVVLLAKKVPVLDVSDCYVTPGLIDLQVNGNKTCNLWGDPTQSQFSDFCRELIQGGVTTFLPTLITDEFEHLRKNVLWLESMGVGRVDGIDTANSTASSTTMLPTIRMPGIHLEGPYISSERAGVHPPNYIRKLTNNDYASLISKGVKVITFAPEQEGTMPFLAFLKKHNIVPAIGHSNATFEETQEAITNGVQLMTHIFNALPPLHHRSVGAVGAALLNDEIYCCLIGDGLHVSIPAIEIVLRLKGPDKVILVTDMASIGTSQAGLIGSSIKLADAVRNLVHWHLASFIEAIAMATFNPAVVLGLGQHLGSIDNGKLADLVIWDKQTLMVKHVILNGELVF